MLLYSLLHLTGYPLSIEDIKKFRQFGSYTAGHPELDQILGLKPTGPWARDTNAVGMALAEYTSHQDLIETAIPLLIIILMSSR